jgi:rhamnosyltransferase
MLAVVTVTYNPDLEILGRQVRELPAQALKIWVDNASPPGIVARMREIAAGRSDLVLVLNPANAGLAAALNQGAAAAGSSAPACRYLLLLDQDTETGPGGAEALLAAFLQLSSSHPRLGCVGPKLIDVETGLEHGFHQISGCRWVRRFDVQDSSIPVANLNGSGTLVERQLFDALHGLDADFFIDHVDTEWSFRVLASGHELLAVPGVAFRHRMGERSIRLWCFGWRLWPYRSPARHAYLFRNTVRLLSRPGVPLCWKIWAPVKLAVTMFVHLIFDAARWSQLQAMWSGIRSGLANPGRGV